MSTLKWMPTKCFYKKGQGELQLKFVPPQEGEQGGVYPGCIMLEIAKAFENSDKSDWSKKIIMKLNDIDCAQILLKIGNSEEAKIFHKSTTRDGGAGTSTLVIKPGQNQGTFRLDVYRDDNGTKRGAGIYLSSVDLFILRGILHSAIPAMYGY